MSRAWNPPSLCSLSARVSDWARLPIGLWWPEKEVTVGEEAGSMETSLESTFTLRLRRVARLRSRTELRRRGRVLRYGVSGRLVDETVEERGRRGGMMLDGAVKGGKGERWTSEKGSKPGKRDNGGRPKVWGKR